MSDYLPAQCFSCVRLRPGTNLCDAFPEGVPESMFLGGDHRKPLPGDHGLQFSQRDTKRARENFAKWQEVFGDGTSGG